MVGLSAAGGCALVKEEEEKVNTYLFGKGRRERMHFPFNCEVSFGGGRREEDGE